MMRDLILNRNDFVLNADKVQTKYDSDDLVMKDNINTLSSIKSVPKTAEYAHILTVGDNFYMKGITHIWFRLIPWLIMNTFYKEGVKDLTFLPVLGNHDCYGGYENEILYSRYNKQWIFTTDYYLIKHPLKDGSKKYFVNLMINSCKFLCFDSGNRSCKFKDQEVKDQILWIESQLKENSVNENVAWIAITLHHPVFTTPVLKESLLNLLREYKVDVIFAGHEHWAEYSNMNKDYNLKMPNSKYGEVLIECDNKNEVLIHKNRNQNFAKGDYLHMFVIGNGGANLRAFCPHKDQDGEVYFRNKENHGFLDIEITESKFTATYWIIPNKIIYTVSIQK